MKVSFWKIMMEGTRVFVLLGSFFTDNIMALQNFGFGRVL